MRRLGLIAVLGVMAAGPAAAQDWSVDLGVAGRMRPTHLGAPDYTFDVVPIVEAEYGSRVKLSLDDGLKWAAFRSGPLDAGPIVEYRQSFDDHLPPGARRMDDAVEVGGFTSVKTPIGIGEARLRHAIGSYDGWSGDLSFDTGAPITPKLTLAGQARLSWADANFTEEYFGLRPHVARSFGLPRFLDEDYLTAGAEVDVLRELTPKTRLVLALTGDRIISELAPSPLFKTHNIFTASLGFTYHWSPSGRPK